MELITPVDLGTAIHAIKELQVNAQFNEGQSQLLISFITSNPENREAFFNFAQQIANEQLPPENEEMQKVARLLVSINLENENNTTQSKDSSSGIKSNVLQFPNFKKDQ